ncbi:DUF397 domain-containing protein [Streptomyces sp. SID12501]|uniref:DUF397 domain-containing protein n=1 Tax=Streptomyces sp. SID12501 TaxID=2706042 RepID=A0A6B3BEQ2_9ACTN|nr:DUF397 domain-containing protein [Streptomyces sp. SID12501]NEC84927.1 DUF397 domain-containing protein [Streptomyces sp. SID12501]
MSAPSPETATWRKSSHSAEGGDCVEIAAGFPNVLPVRDSKDASGPNLAFDTRAWTSFMTALKADELPSA